MGNESSTMVDENTPPQVLKSRTVEGVAEYIKSGRCKNIVVMTGAGISTSAGIPDFRSPDTGLYANLARLNLPYAEAVFDISYFRKNPLPFYTLAQELYPGKYRPTITHSFIKLLHTKSLLLKHFTQNIDCLDREAGVPGSHIIEAHGSFARQSCVECHAPFPESLMKTAIRTSTPPYCQKKTCNGLIKPEIVFFGEALPNEFFAARDVPYRADLAIVMGTSLTVQPFASLPSLIPEGVPRVLINKEQVGGLGSRSDDVLLLGDCDDGVRKLSKACGWDDELEKLWEKTGGKPVAEPPSKAKSKDEQVEDEVNKLTSDIEKSLSVSDKFDKQTREELPKKVEDHLAGATEESKAGQGPQIQKDIEKPESSAKKEQPKSEQDAKGDSDSAKGDIDSGLKHVYPHAKSNLS